MSYLKRDEALLRQVQILLNQDRSVSWKINRLKELCK